MTELTIRTLDNREQRLDTVAVEGLAASLRGEVLTPTAPGYEAARTVWNAMIDRRPALMARCTDTADVIQAVNFARTHGLLTAVRGGGHNIAGHAVCEGGFMIDLTPMQFFRSMPRLGRSGSGPAPRWALSITRRRRSAWPPRSALTPPPGLPDSPSAAVSAG